MSLQRSSRNCRSAVTSGRGPPDLASGHALGPDEVRRAIGAEKVDLRLPVPEHVHMRRRVIVGEDDDPQPLRAQHRDHVGL